MIDYINNPIEIPKVKRIQKIYKNKKKIKKITGKRILNVTK